MKQLTVLSLGAGVQSSVLALLLSADDAALSAAWRHSRRYPARPDVAIFADTGWEPDYVYDHLDWLETQLAFPVERVSAGNIRENLAAGTTPAAKTFTDIPLYVINPSGTDGMLRRECTSHYKIDPINRAVRAMLGYAPRQRIPEGAVDMLMGISTDEFMRIKTNRSPWITNRYPLIDAGLSRADCRNWFQLRYPDRELPRSACVICPYRGDGEWLELERREPGSYQDAVRFDAWMRTSAGRATMEHLAGEPYLHRTRTPLGEAVQAVREARDAQPEMDLFGDDCEGYCGV